MATMSTASSTTAYAPTCLSNRSLCKFKPLQVSARTATLSSKKNKRAMGVRCEFLGSPTNLIMIGSTTLMLFAGRFGLAPSANRKSTAGLKLQDRDSGLQTGDPAGFTGTDTLACGAFGHIIGVGLVLGLKAIGSIP